ncbi:MAG: hypothetical protein QM808_17990 [Steroidobacteraceae bacterium]
MNDAMNPNTQIDDELLMSYADGELDAEQQAVVEQALRQDVSLAARVAQHRALRTQLQDSFADVLSEPTPERFLKTLQSPAATDSARIIDLTQMRQRKTAERTHWDMRHWGAMAASLLVGTLIGFYALNSGTGSLIGNHDGAVIAQGELARSLTTQLASSNNNDQAINMGISFRNHAGEYCRSFIVRGGKSLQGLACRQQGNWQLRLLTESTVTSNGEFRQAASETSDTVLALINAQVEGEPLDSEAEAAAQRAGWR